MNSMKGKRVFAGLSGGVDSAVSAALLQRAGALVEGVFIKGWYPPGMPCTWAEDRRDAMRVAARLGIPFHTLDASEDYKKGVIDYLVAEYAAGRTPNPDVMCNREVKFGAFYRFAREKEAEFIATGHYARAERAPDGSPMLLRGIDPAKDQSYFLWAIPKDALAMTILPVGGLKKDETRRLAREFGLPVAEKRDSQGICFLGSVSVEDFLRAEFHPKSGAAVDEEGKVIGTHEGALLYTIGQRVALQDASAGPWYVAAKDMAANRITVAHEAKHGAARAAIEITSANWFAGAASATAAQYRYHGATIEGRMNGSRFEPGAPLRENPAAGQSLVLYDGDRVIGGGIIAE